MDENELIERTAAIVSAYVGNHALSAADVPSIIKATYEALSGAGKPPEPTEPERGNPAVSVKKSITDNKIICLECGRSFSSIRRHLLSAHGQTPDAYKAHWSLPSDYPMVAPNYSAERSRMALEFGLGRKAAPVVVSKPAKPKPAKQAEAAPIVEPPAPAPEPVAKPSTKRQPDEPVKPARAKLKLNFDKPEPEGVIGGKPIDPSEDEFT